MSLKLPLGKWSKEKRVKSIVCHYQSIKITLALCLLNLHLDRLLKLQQFCAEFKPAQSYREFPDSVQKATSATIT